MALLLLAMLPVPPKLKEISLKENQSAENNAIIHNVLVEVMRNLQRDGQEGILLACLDGMNRLCFPMLCAWITDHMEHILLQNIKNNFCPKFEVPPERLGKPP